MNDELILQQLTERFAALETMTVAVSQGVVRSVIAAGAPGVGKSYGVEGILNNLPDRYKFVTISGKMSAVGLYKTLFENRDRGCTILIDDCDSIFQDESALNLLKKAVDTSEKRMISWNTDSKFETDEGDDIPRSFEFHGGIIILTNKNLTEIAESDTKYAVHVDALLSRSVFIDLGFTTNRSKFLRVKQVIQSGMLTNAGISYDLEQDILWFLEENLDNLREISIRTALKIVALTRVDQKNWKTLAKVTVCR